MELIREAQVVKAHLAFSSVMKEKGFITFTTGVNVVNPFY
jgi:hypothetical protein